MAIRNYVITTLSENNITAKIFIGYTYIYIYVYIYGGGICVCVVWNEIMWYERD